MINIFIKELFNSIKIFSIMLLVIGFGYTGFVTIVSQIFFSKEANGSLIFKNGEIVGSKLIAQKFSSDKYFWARPSAVDYNPMPSGASNLGPTSQQLKLLIDSRNSSLSNSALDKMTDVLLSSSASGLDPHISPALALAQADRVGKARGLTNEKLQKLIESYTINRDLGFLGEKRINVLELNLALDKILNE